MTDTISEGTLGLMASAAPDFGAHQARLGDLPRLSAAELVTQLEAAGLTGRGGAGFPTAQKLAALTSRRGVVIGNGVEGEPASAKDRWLLAAAPHLVLDGLTIVGRAVNSSRLHVVAPSDSCAYLRRARSERRGPHIDIKVAEDRFVAGQETAVVSAAEGKGPALPRTAHTPIRQRGAHGRPTLVLNVETLAHVALIARWGGNWFRSQGTVDDPGSRLITLSGAVRRPGVFEAAGGTTIDAALGAAGGESEPLRAVLVGGYHGTWLPWSTTTRHLALSPNDLAQHGASIGAGVVLALPVSRCGLQASADIARYLAGESAGQCGPCVFGLPALAAAMSQLAFADRTRAAAGEVRRLAGLVVGRGACRHPDGTARFVKSSLNVFADELDLHSRGRCSRRPFHE